MKTKFFIISAIALMLCAAGCKTNEKNYREAYLKAKERATDTGDSVTTADFRASREPQVINIDSVRMPVLTMHVALSEQAGNNADATIQRYMVCVGRFKQIFNAKSMRQRLADGGYPDAMVVYNGSQEYFVVACGTYVAAEAPALLEKVAHDSSLTLREPYPFILRAAQLVR